MALAIAKDQGCQQVYFKLSLRSYLRCDSERMTKCRHDDRYCIEKLNVGATEN